MMVQNEYDNHKRMKKEKPFIVCYTDAYRLHKFIDIQQDEQDGNVASSMLHPEETKIKMS